MLFKIFVSGPKADKCKWKNSPCYWNYDSLGWGCYTFKVRNKIITVRLKIFWLIVLWIWNTAKDVVLTFLKNRPDCFVNLFGGRGQYDHRLFFITLLKKYWSKAVEIFWLFLNTYTPPLGLNRAFILNGWVLRHTTWM